MIPAPFLFTARLWLYPGKAGWHFVTLPEEIGAEIRLYSSLTRKGWGSVPVSARIGSSEWRTSIFPDKASQSYFLPVKSDIRFREFLRTDTDIEVTLAILP